MIYSDIYKEFKEKIPEAVSFCREKEKQFMLDDNDGMHVLFGFAVRPFVLKSLIEEDETALEKIADFFEQMEADEDDEIGAVLEQSVLETLLAENRELITKNMKIWKSETRKAIEVVGQFIV